MSRSKTVAGPLMRSEILEQPESLIRVAESGRALLSREKRGNPFSSRFLSRVERVVIFGNGSSYHAACLARDYLIKVARVPARAAYASDAFLWPEPRPSRTLALAFSHSGRSGDVLGAARRARRRGIPTGAITNVGNSPLGRGADACWVTGAGIENAIPSTKGFTALAGASLLLAFHVAGARGVSNKSVHRAALLVSRAARTLGVWLSEPDRVQFASSMLTGARAVAFVGKGLFYPVACDGALKLLEVAYIPALAYPPEEFRHGPIAMADEGFVLIALVPQRWDPTLLKIVEEVSAAGAAVLTVGQTGPTTANGWVQVPRVDPLVAPLVCMPALQLMAHGVGAILQHPIDRPRGLQKVVGAA